MVRGALPGGRPTRADLIAGLPGAIGCVPNGMAAGTLAGVSPVHGLYASMAGPLFGGIATSTTLMIVTTTNASALAAGSALGSVEPGDRAASLTLLTLVAGVVMVVAGAVRLGRYTRFVSHSVMTGFLLGIAANIVFSQAANLTGARPGDGSPVEKAWRVLVHPSSIDGWSLVVGVLAIAMMAGFARTRVRLLASLVALIVPTALVVAFGWDSVARVSDVGEIPTGFPIPHVPTLSLLSPSLIAGAAAVALIVLVQAAGVADAAPNATGPRSDTNRDFVAQGIGNLGSAFFRGIPVGGSVGQTALNRTAGARTRWASVSTGVWMLVILVAFAGIVGRVAMPTLAAVLIVAAVGSCDPARVIAIWSSGTASRVVLLATFVATLALPVTAALGVGVVLSLLMQLNRDALDLRVVRLRVHDGQLVEAPVPKYLSAGEIAILDVYGSLFYAGSRTLQLRLPDPAHAHGSVVILRLRGRTTLNATFFAVVADYARRLDEVGGRLYLSGVDRDIYESWTATLRAGHGVRLEFFPATPVVGESTLAAYAQARVRIDERFTRDE